MAVDVSQMSAQRENTRNAGAQDARIMQRAVIICAGAAAILIAIKLGFMQRVLP